MTTLFSRSLARAIRSLAVASGVALAIAALGGCSSSQPEGQEQWTPIAQLSASNPQAAENSGAAAGKCNGQNAMAPFRNASVTEDETVYRVQRGDKLHVAFYRNSEFDKDVTVRPDGKFTIEPVGDIAAVGYTPEQLADKIDIKFSDTLIDPSATVRVVDSPFRQVFIGGQVAYPGLQELRPGMTAIQALSLAGWSRDWAKLDQVVLIRRDACGRPYGTFIQVANASSDPSVGAQQDVMLMPSDTIIVPRSTIGNLNLWVQQYIRNMLPVEPYIGLPVF